MAFCKFCKQWYNCFCMRCRNYEPYDNTFPRKDGVKDKLTWGVV